jgi:hypothetical protein
VEDELLHVVATAIPGADELPPELDEAVSQLAVLDDAELLRDAGPRHLRPLALERRGLHGVSEPRYQAARRRRRRVAAMAIIAPKPNARSGLSAPAISHPQPPVCPPLVAGPPPDPPAPVAALLLVAVVALLLLAPPPAPVAALLLVAVVALLLLAPPPAPVVVLPVSSTHPWVDESQT